MYKLFLDICKLWKWTKTLLHCFSFHWEITWEWALYCWIYARFLYILLCYHNIWLVKTNLYLFWLESQGPQGFKHWSICTFTLFIQLTSILHLLFIYTAMFSSLTLLISTTYSFFRIAVIQISDILVYLFRVSNTKLVFDRALMMINTTWSFCGC